MQLQDLVGQIPGFAQQGHSEKIKLFVWYLHVSQNIERVTAAALRQCYDDVHLPQPTNINPYLAQLAEKKSPDLLRDKSGYRLVGPVRAAFDAKYGQSPTALLVDKTLADLPNLVSNMAEKVFLNEAITCYRHKAFRAAIVMTWNLTYDHILDWLLQDPVRLATFNARLPVRFPRKPPLTIALKDQFEELKESEVIQVCSSAGLISGNLTKILEEKLARRNLAVHPSTVQILQYQADDVITDLVNNVILKLA